jgi:hypothetical protein
MITRLRIPCICAVFLWTTPSSSPASCGSACPLPRSRLLNNRKSRLWLIADTSLPRRRTHVCYRQIFLFHFSRKTLLVEFRARKSLSSLSRCSFAGFTSICFSSGSCVRNRSKAPAFRKLNLIEFDPFVAGLSVRDRKGVTLVWVLLEHLWLWSLDEKDALLEAADEELSYRIEGGLCFFSISQSRYCTALVFVCRSDPMEASTGGKFLQKFRLYETRSVRLFAIFCFLLCWLIWSSMQVLCVRRSPCLQTSFVWLCCNGCEFFRLCCDLMLRPRDSYPLRLVHFN